MSACVYFKGHHKHTPNLMQWLYTVFSSCIKVYMLVHFASIYLCECMNRKMRGEVHKMYSNIVMITSFLWQMGLRDHPLPKANQCVYELSQVWSQGFLSSCSSLLYWGTFSTHNWLHGWLSALMAEMSPRDKASTFCWHWRTVQNENPGHRVC